MQPRCNDFTAPSAVPLSTLTALTHTSASSLPRSSSQGQEIIARKYMATASLEGQWVLLQNTHLGLGYLTEVRGEDEQRGEWGREQRQREGGEERSTSKRRARQPRGHIILRGGLSMATRVSQGQAYGRETVGLSAAGFSSPL